MNALQALFLGVLQGATEFLPVSSSGHLVVIPWLLRWKPPGLVFDTMVHWGTLAAVVIYFWHDLLDLAVAWFDSIRERDLTADPRRLLAWLLILGTIPAALAGFLFESQFESLFSKPLWVAIFWLVTGVILFGSERIGKRIRPLTALGWTDALLIGVAQAFAVTPGISRSGSTIGMGLVRDLDREAATRFSFLLMTPIVFGAGLLKLADLVTSGGESQSVTLLILGFSAAAVSGFACIAWLLRYVRNHSLDLFAWYCWLAGAVTLFVAAVGWR
jgi:undecaprenyl-diphosphatase